MIGWSVQYLQLNGVDHCIFFCQITSFNFGRLLPFASTFVAKYRFSIVFFLACFDFQFPFSFKIGRFFFNFWQLWIFYSVKNDQNFVLSNDDFQLCFLQLHILFFCHILFFSFWFVLSKFFVKLWAQLFFLAKIDFPTNFLVSNFLWNIYFLWFIQSKIEFSFILLPNYDFPFFFNT